MAKGAFSKKVREAVWDRCGGLCERCGVRAPTDLHHRRPRGMGGDSRPNTGSVTNALALCRDCHHWVEMNRSEAREGGFLVRSVHDPAAVPVLYRGCSVLLEG